MWETGNAVTRNRKEHHGWVLVREEVTRIAGNSGWTTQDPHKKPDILAYRNQNEHVWYKGRPNEWYVRIENTRRENIEQEEVVALLLMARKA
jgi:hypothetical protein